MKKYFKDLILIVFYLILMISVGCSSLKVNSNKNIDITSKKELNEVISSYISDYYSRIFTNADKTFEAHKVYTVEEKDGLINVYIYTLFEGYAFANGKFGLSCGGSNPALIVLKKDNSKFTVVKFEQPKDGSEYGPSMKKMFPRKYVEEAMSDSSRDLGLHEQINLKAKAWLKEQGRSETLV